jgi:REP element-mobilizing transposase RayT
MTERLHRLERLHPQYPAYFLTCCTAARQPLLASQQIHDAFVQFCHAASPRNIFVGRYVLMPDHLHLFVKFSDPSHDLSSWVKSLKNSLSKTLRQAGHPAPHWQKGFFDHVLRASESYSQKWLYVAENPVRAGLVKERTEWPWQGEIHTLRIDEDCSGGL